MMEVRFPKDPPSLPEEEVSQIVSLVDTTRYYGCNSRFDVLLRRRKISSIEEAQSTDTEPSRKEGPGCRDDRDPSPHAGRGGGLPSSAVSTTGMLLRRTAPFVRTQVPAPDPEEPTRRAEAGRPGHIRSRSEFLL